MAQGEKKGFIARMLEGKERDENYARSTLPSNRWALFWDIFKGRFSKLIIVNLLMLVFCIPMIVVFVFRYIYTTVQGVVMPFAGWVGSGYPITPNLVGVPQQVVLSTNLLFGALMVIAAFVAAVGISGGIYVIRNMVWTEGIFVANDFWRGIKINFVVVLQSTVFYGVLLYLFTISINWSQYLIAVGEGNSVLLTISVAVSYIAIAILTLMFLWMLSMGGNYKLKFWQLVKNSFLMTFGLIFQNVFFAALMAIPVILVFLGSFFQIVGIVILVLFGLSYMLLVWFNYSQWAFDKFFESKREGGKVNRGIYAKVGKGGAQSKAVQEYQANLEAAMSVKSDLSSRPIKPITDELKVYELPESYSREDLQKLRESKDKIIEDTESYAEEHKNDEKYVVYNAQFDKKEEESEENGKGKKKKKSSQKEDSSEDGQ
ncbi:MAG TPA: hypothetical protein H9729_01945 [Candidatus Borkfalkia excrementigallinarum]|uniref:Uncharacterized protein n=1 Tax=Candidatus Borkfalkia excrementigallinarum TaxID=2838506 RepID=A0A9D1ZTZ4_9FIRM|nr:hypothetical protein [Candidatus Borkfalkia excrementigallinarum]